jgi:hypothetical protein
VDQTVKTLIEFERALATRTDPGILGGLAALIDDDFLEFGASGRRWERTDVLELLREPAEGQLQLSDVDCSLIAADVALLTYTTTSAERPPVLRSSLWVRRDGAWRLRFHQGTPQARASTTPR